MKRVSLRENSMRLPAVAGTFYPADPQRLEAMVRGFLAEATVPSLKDVRAVIAPHAGYIYSGPTAGYAFKVWEGLPQRPYTIYLMGPAHYVYVPGAAVGQFSHFLSPLGEVPVAEELVEALLSQGEPFLEANRAHQPEHCLEVELPFLQVIFGNHFRIVPILFGDVDPADVAIRLVDFLTKDPNALVVVSSDLSHYHDYWTARRLDQAFLDAVVKGNLQDAQKGEACGLLPILTLMHLALRLGWRPHPLDYRNSGDTAGDKARVVGYAAVAYEAT